RWCSRFGTEEITVLGYPGTGSYASCAMAFVITAFADKPDLVWELLRSLIPPYDRSFYNNVYPGIPALRSIYLQQTEELADYYQVYPLAGGYTTEKYDPEHPLTAEMLDEPAFFTRWDEEKVETVFDFLDHGVTVSVMDTLPEDIAAIVHEEISAYLAGLGTAEDCGEKIRSRVEIWYAEHN
ncbi:MAG: hypothetical protein IJC71_07715, partial [Clostridia bacterium]|nr:hypothetical protein [Clostridia bacterium]